MDHRHFVWCKSSCRRKQKLKKPSKITIVRKLFDNKSGKFKRVQQTQVKYKSSNL